MGRRRIGGKETFSFIKNLLGGKEGKMGRLLDGEIEGKKVGEVRLF